LLYLTKAFFILATEQTLSSVRASHKSNFLIFA